MGRRKAGKGMVCARCLKTISQGDEYFYERRYQERFHLECRPAWTKRSRP